MYFKLWYDFSTFGNTCHVLKVFFFRKRIVFTYLFLAAQGLHCCAQTFSSCSSQELLFVVMGRLFIVVASLVLENEVGLRASAVATQAQQCGLRSLELGLRSWGMQAFCPSAYGIFPDQGSNLCPLRWQAESYPLCHPESLSIFSK